MFVLECWNSPQLHLASIIDSRAERVAYYHLLTETGTHTCVTGNEVVLVKALFLCVPADRVCLLLRQEVWRCRRMKMAVNNT